MESSSQGFSKVVMQTMEIQALRGELDSLNISDSDVQKEGENHPSTSTDQQEPIIVDIADWQQVKHLFRYNMTNTNPPIFRDPTYQQAPMFIKTVEEYFRYNKIPSEYHLTVVKNLFRGPSNNWKDFHEGKWQCYKDFRRHFLSTFWSENEQIKERERLSIRKYTPTKQSSMVSYFLLVLNKYRFFSTQLSEDVILKEIMSMYPPEIQSSWAVRTSKTFASALSFLQGLDRISNGKDGEEVSDTIEKIQGLNDQLYSLDISEEFEVNNTVQNGMNTADTSSTLQNSSTFNLSHPQNATFIFEYKATPPVYLAGQNPAKFIKDLEDYFSYAIVSVEDQLTTAKSLLRGKIKDWKNKNEKNWMGYEEFRDDFLTTFWTKERQSWEWTKLNMQKFNPVGTSDLAEFFMFIVNRYRLFTPPLPEITILTQTMGKYPIEIQSLWLVSGCLTLDDTLSFLERQDEIGVLNILGKSNLGGTDPPDTNISCSPASSEYASMLNASEGVYRLDRQMHKLHISDGFMVNNVVKNENNGQTSSMYQASIGIQMKVSPPIFKDKKNQNAAQFMKKLREYLSLAQIPTEHQLTVAKSLLQGNAIDWKDFHEKNWITLEDFCRDFMTSFWSEHKQRLIRQRLNQTKFVPGPRNNLTRYFLNQVRSYRLFTPPMHESEILREIMSHFPAEIVSLWSSVGTKTLDTAFSFLEKQEAKGYSRHRQPADGVNKKRRSNSSPYPQQRSHHYKPRPYQAGKMRMPQSHQSWPR